MNGFVPSAFLFFGGLLILQAQLAPGLHGPTVIVTVARDAEFDVRDRASHELRYRLPLADLVALSSFLVRKPAEDSASADELASLKNNVADALLAQTELPSGLLQALESAFADADQGEIWREYVVQKMPELVKRADGEQRERGLAFLRERIRDTGYIYAGTSLLGLQRLHDHSVELVTSSEVAKSAQTILMGEGYRMASKMTALQILALHDKFEARALAKKWLVENEAVMLRISALATLGSVGDRSDFPEIERYAKSPEMRLRKTAQAALIKINARSPQ